MTDERAAGIRAAMGLMEQWASVLNCYLYTDVTPPGFDNGAQPPPLGAGPVIVGPWM